MCIFQPIVTDIQTGCLYGICEGKAAESGTFKGQRKGHLKTTMINLL